MSQRVDPERGSDSPVTVERSVDRKTEGVTVTYHFAALPGDTVGVRVVQPLAGEQAVRDVGFHPEHEPAAWTQSDAAVVFDTVVDGETEVVLGVAGDRDRVLPADADASVTGVERGVDADPTDFLFGDPFPGSGWLGGVRRVLLGSDDADTPEIPIVDRDTERDEGDGITVEAANGDGDGDAEVDWSGLQSAVEPIEDPGDIVIEAVDDEHAEVTDADLAGAEAETDDAEDEASAEAVPPVDDVVVDAEAGRDASVLDDELVDAIERVDDTSEGVDADADTEAALDSEPASERERIDPTGDEPEAVEPESAPVATENDGTDVEPVEPDPADEPEPIEAESEPLEPETAEEGEEDAASKSGAVEAASSAVEPEPSESPESPEAADVAARLAAELEAGDVEAETLDALREQLRSAEDATDVRLRHVQSRMSDFEAYVDALEDVIEAHGTASPFMEETEARLDEIDDEVAAAETRLEAEADARADLGERVDDEVESVEARVDEVDADVANVERNVEGVAGDVDDLRASLTDVEREVSELRNTHETRFRRLEDDVNMLATDVRETREDLQTEVASLEDELEEMRSFRETLSAAFDTGSASGASDGE